MESRKKEAPLGFRIKPGEGCNPAFSTKGGGVRSPRQEKFSGMEEGNLLHREEDADKGKKTGGQKAL